MRRSRCGPRRSHQCRRAAYPVRPQSVFEGGRAPSSGRKASAPAVSGWRLRRNLPPCRRLREQPLEALDRGRRQAARGWLPHGIQEPERMRPARMRRHRHSTRRPQHRSRFRHSTRRPGHRSRRRHSTRRLRHRSRRRHSTRRLRHRSRFRHSTRRPRHHSRWRTRRRRLEVAAQRRKRPRAAAGRATSTISFRRCAEARDARDRETLPQLPSDLRKRSEFGSNPKSR